MFRIEPNPSQAPGRVLTRDPDAESRRATRDLVGKVITFFFIIGAIRAAPVFLGTA